MSVSFQDPGAISAIYESIVEHGHNWVVLTYANDTQFDELSLYDYGSEGLEELKSKIEDLDQVFIAFYREETGETPGFALINYVPTTVSGVRRARALVHARRVGTIFKKHQATITVEHFSELTTTAIHQALISASVPDSPAAVSMGRTFSQPVDLVNKPLPSHQAMPTVSQLQPVRRSFSEAYSMSGPPPPASSSAPPTKSSSMFSNILRRKKKTGDSDRSVSPPPPTPPKDKGNSYMQQSTRHDTSSQALNAYSYAVPTPPKPISRRTRTNSLSEFAVISHAHTHSSSSDEVLVDSPVPPPKLPAAMAPSRSLPLRGKWAPDTDPIADPAERTRRRLEAQRQREMEEQEVLREEALRQARIKREKEEILRREEEEDAQRRASLDDELRRITAERRRKEQVEMEEDERKRRQLEAKKRMDREKRMEEHRKLEEWRKEQARQTEEAARRAERAKVQEDMERRKRIQLVEAKVKRNTKAESMLSGWVTMQTSDSLFWKRRYFRFTGSTAYFYRSPKDTHQILDKLDFRGKIRGLREWNEGYEELEAIPHSFAVEFKDQTTWSMFADSEEEKDKVLGLLHHAAGL